MSERGEAKRDGAKLHKNSGRNTTKGDATWNEFVVDYKGLAVIEWELLEQLLEEQE
jgi:hypothetical protein